MRLFLIAALLLSWQSTPLAKNRIGEQNAGRKANQEQQEVGSPAPVVSIGECFGCFQESAPTHHQENGNLYDPRSDTLYRWYLRMTILGVVGAFLGLFILFLQTRHTGRQVAALMNAERAFLIMDGTPELDDAKMPYPSFVYKLANIGKTPAILVEAYGRLQIGRQDNPVPPDPSIYDHDKIIYPMIAQKVIPANEKSTEVGRSHPVSTQQWDAVFKTRDDCLWACGFFIYLDMFGREYEQQFCYRYFVYEGINRFNLIPPKYNRLFQRKKRTYYPKYKTQP
jgi:hypothetical protein